MPLNATVEIYLMQILDNDTGQTISPTYTQNAGSRFYNGIVDGKFGYGETIDLTGFFGNTEVKQREFMKWIFTMFNLYVEPTEIDKNLVILPREEFLTNQVRDWTEKRDLSQPLGDPCLGRSTPS